MATWRLFADSKQILSTAQGPRVIPALDQQPEIPDGTSFRGREHKNKRLSPENLSLKAVSHAYLNQPGLHSDLKTVVASEKWAMKYALIELLWYLVLVEVLPGNEQDARHISVKRPDHL